MAEYTLYVDSSCSTTEPRFRGHGITIHFVICNEYKREVWRHSMPWTPTLTEETKQILQTATADHGIFIDWDEDWIPKVRQLPIYPKQQNNATCFLDMDGVLVDYYWGVCRLYGIEPYPYPFPVGVWNFFGYKPLDKTWDEVGQHMGFDFFANLPWTPDGQAILKHCEASFGEENVCLLTSPWEVKGCRDGKMAWINKHIPKYRRKVLIGAGKHFCAHPNSYLVDDSDDNCKKFYNSGGRYLKIPRLSNNQYSFCDHNTGAASEEHLKSLFTERQ